MDRPRFLEDPGRSRDKMVNSNIPDEIVITGAEGIRRQGLSAGKLIRGNSGQEEGYVGAKHPFL